MPLTYTLDDSIVEFLFRLTETIKNKEYWTPMAYDATFEALQVAADMIKDSYKRLTASSLEETSRRLFVDVQGGGIETYINYYNGFLFVRKLQYRLRWHQKYGSFPD